jgi:hypothetical protein
MVYFSPTGKNLDRGAKTSIAYYGWGGSSIGTPKISPTPGTTAP